jgi:hypothetical protein
MIMQQGEQDQKKSFIIKGSQQTAAVGSLDLPAEGSMS